MAHAYAPEARRYRHARHAKAQRSSFPRLRSTPPPLFLSRARRGLPRHASFYHAMPPRHCAEVHAGSGTYARHAAANDRRVDDRLHRMAEQAAASEARDAQQRRAAVHARLAAAWRHVHRHVCPQRRSPARHAAAAAVQRRGMRDDWIMNMLRCRHATRHVMSDEDDRDNGDDGQGASADVQRPFDMPYVVKRHAI